MSRDAELAAAIATTAAGRAMLAAQAGNQELAALWAAVQAAANRVQTEGGRTTNPKEAAR